MNKSHGINTRMNEEIPILILKHTTKILVGITVGSRKPPLSVVSDARPEQTAVISSDNSGVRDIKTRHRDTEERYQKHRNDNRYQPPLPHLTIVHLPAAVW